MAIETLRAGDWIVTRDQHDADGQLVLRQIEETFHRTAQHLLFLTIRSSTGQTQTLTTTNEHPVYVEGLGWIKALDLEPGHNLLEPDGGTSTVIATRHETHREGISVYNFRVNEAHTYFVREEGSTAEPVWVHNNCRQRFGVDIYGNAQQTKTPGHALKLARAAINMAKSGQYAKVFMHSKWSTIVD